VGRCAVRCVAAFTRCHVTQVRYRTLVHHPVSDRYETASDIHHPPSNRRNAEGKKIQGACRVWGRWQRQESGQRIRLRTPAQISKTHSRWRSQVVCGRQMWCGRSRRQQQQRMMSAASNAQRSFVRSMSQSVLSRRSHTRRKRGDGKGSRRQGMPKAVAVVYT